MKERIIIAIGNSGCWVAIGDEVKYFNDRADTRSYMSLAYFSANQLALSKNFIIINDFTSPKWTVEDHLYFFLGEELYNEFWSEYRLNWISFQGLLDLPTVKIEDAFPWRLSQRGGLFWHGKSNHWKIYCEEMGLEQGVIL